MRHLVEVIDQITDIAPDLKSNFSSLRSSVLYTAPELMGSRWDEAAMILNSHALNHPKQPEIAKIFSDVKDKETA